MAEGQNHLEIAREIEYIDEHHFKEIDEKCNILGKMLGSLIKARTSTPSPITHDPSPITYYLFHSILPSLSRVAGQGMLFFLIVRSDQENFKNPLRPSRLRGSIAFRVWVMGHR